jgi:hypothetical protein
MNVIQTLDQAPFEAPPEAVRDGGFSEDWWGAFSVQHFVDQAELHATHADATGWLDYLTKFHPRNFWFADGGVQRWAYIEDYDNWQDTYGMDAVMAVYHSGHGGMGADGVFFVPLGADWSGSHSVTSNEMRFGNEQANYIFWSTCLSLRVLDGQNPIKTWAGANGGFRMLFGFETTSVDSGDYGKFFWEEWNKKKSLSQAWLDESWRISTYQAPSAVACGATAAEAKDRLFNERMLSWGHVSSAYWWWRWYYAAPGVAAREPNVELPKDLLIADLRPPELSEHAVRDMLARFGIDGPLLRETLQVTPDGIASIEVGDQRVAFGRNGSMEVQLATPNRDNLDQLPGQEAIRAAQDAIGARGLGVDAELVFDQIRHGAEGGGSAEGSGELQGPFVTETTVQFRQVINGLPVLTPDAGQVRVTVDNDGTVTSVQSTTREIARLSDRPRSTVMAPPSPGSRVTTAAEPPDPEQRLAEVWSNRLASWAGSQGRAPSEAVVVPGTTEVGYEVVGNEAVLAARRLVEVGLGRGCRKQYWVVAPLVA